MALGAYFNQMLSALRRDPALDEDEVRARYRAQTEGTLPEPPEPELLNRQFTPAAPPQMEHQVQKPEPQGAAASPAAQSVRRAPAVATPTQGEARRGTAGSPPATSPQNAAEPGQAPVASGAQAGQTQATGLPLTLEQLRQKAYERAAEAARVGSEVPDLEGQRRLARMRQESATEDQIAALNLQMTGGEVFQDYAGKMLTRALAQQGRPHEIPGGWGTIERGEVFLNPFKQKEAEANRLAAEANFLEKQATNVENAEHRRQLLEEAKLRREDAKQARQDALEFKYFAAGMAGSASADRRAAREEREAERKEAAGAKRTDTVRREYNARRDKVAQGSGFSDAVVQTLASPNIAKDAQAQVALVMQFGKMLDPDSVVREAEQRMIAEARGWFDSLQITPQRIMSGQFLTPRQLAQMRQIALQYQSGYSQRVRDLDDFYAGLAERNKLPVGDIVPNWKPSGERGAGGGREIDVGATVGAQGSAPRGSAERRRVDY